MAESFPNKLPVDGVECSFEINKVYVQRKVVLQTVVNNGTERINLADAH